MFSSQRERERERTLQKCSLFTLVSLARRGTPTNANATKSVIAKTKTEDDKPSPRRCFVKFEHRSFLVSPHTCPSLLLLSPHTKKVHITTQNASLPIHHRARVHLFREQGGKETKSLLLLLDDDGRPCRAGNHRDGCGAQSGRAVLSRHQGASMTE